MSYPTKPSGITAGSGSDVTISDAGVSTVGDDKVDVATDIAITSEAQGDVIYRGASDWARLGKGTTGQPLVVNEGATAPEWRTSLPSSKRCHIFEDFLGATGLLDAGSIVTTGAEPTSPWVTNQTETTGNEVIHALVADADDGQLKLGFGTTSEEQAAVLYWGDEANIPGDKNPVVIFRLKFDPNGAAYDTAVELAFGICGAQNNDINAATHQASFSIDGANLDILINSDDNAAPDADNDASFAPTKGTFYEFKIDAAVPADVQFSYRATLGGAWTPLLAATAFPISGAANFQPFVQIHRSANTVADALVIDYIECSWDRS